VDPLTWPTGTAAAPAAVRALWNGNCGCHCTHGFMTSPLQFHATACCDSLTKGANAPQNISVPDCSFHAIICASVMAARAARPAITARAGAGSNSSAVPTWEFPCSPMHHTTVAGHRLWPMFAPERLDPAPTPTVPLAASREQVGHSMKFHECCHANQPCSVGVPLAQLYGSHPAAQLHFHKQSGASFLHFCSTEAHRCGEKILAVWNS